MFKAFEFRLPTNATKVPAGPKFLALVMLASAVAVSSTSAFAQTHKRTHYRSSNSMNVIKGAGRTAAHVGPEPRFQPTRCLQAGRRGAIADAESTRVVSMHDARGAEPMSILKLFASTILASLVATHGDRRARLLRTILP